MGVPFKAKNGLDANSNKIVNVANPTTAQDAATKLYVDNAVGTGLPSQTGNNGKFLTTNGTTASWSLVPVGGISATGTPSSTTYLRGDGTWATVTSGSGDVVGPASATDNAVVRFDGTTGKLIQNSTVTLSDTGVLTVPELSTASITSTGNNPIIIAPDGTGDVHLNADSVRIGDNNLDATLLTRGTGDLLLTTNEGSATEGVIRLYDGANGNITITPNGTGNVGIGTASPSAKLSIYKGSAGVLATLQGGGTACGFAQGVVGGANTFEIQTQDTTTGTLATRYLIRGGADNANHEWYAGARGSETAKMFLDSTNGFLGIGTITPASKLNVSGGNVTVSAGYGIAYSADQNRIMTPEDNVSGALIAWASGGICRFLTASTERMRITSDGSVGLSTTNPVYKMQIEPTTVTAGGVNNLLRIGTQSITTGTTSRFSMFCSTDPVNDTNGGKVFIDAIRTATNMDLAFLLNNTGGAAPVERMRLTGEGNLGLGTNNPLARIDIVGDSTPNGNGLAFGHANTAGYKWIQSFAGQALYINPLGNNVVFNRDGGNVGISNVSPSQKLDINGNIRLFGSSNNVYLLLRNNHQSIWGARVLCWDYGDGQGINFETSDNTDTWGTRMVVRHNGNVGISTTAPAYKLDINGTARTTGRFYSNEWIQFDNFSALYSPHNGAHFLPNASSYGSWKILGQRNGWCGLEFETTSNGNVSLMIRPDAIETGFHNNSNGWQLRWNGGTLYCHKGTYGGGTIATVLDSSNYSSYALPLSGGTISGSIYATSNNSGGEFYSYGWFRNYNSGTGIYNQATGNHFYSDGGYWNVAYGGTQGIRFRNGHAGAVLGYVYAETSGYFGLLTNQGNWSVLSRPNGGGIILYGTSVDVAQTLYVHEADNKTRVPRTFVQSSTPTGTLTNGDIWIQF